MKRLSFPFSLLVLSLLIVSCSDPEATRSDELLGQTLDDHAIVVLDEAFAPGGHAANRAEAARIARDLGLAPDNTYGTALFGFSAVVPPQRLAALERDPRVAYVERDKVVTTLHHQCGHEGGPPGSGGGTACDPGDVSGTVSDAETGDGIDGATVVLEDTEYDSASTDSEGFYEIENVDGGDYTATASAADYQPKSQEITVDGDTQVDFSLEREEDGSEDDDDGSNQTLPWGVERIEAPTEHTGAGIHVYVIDTGIDADHGDLEANLGNGHAVASCRGGGCVADWDDDNGHGTHVAGTVAAIDNEIDVIGVVPDATLHAVKVLANNGSGSLSDVIAGIDWVADQTRGLEQATVANMSLGASGSKEASCDDGGFNDSDGSDAFHEAVCNAAHVGVVFAVAAGNSGADAENAVPAAYDDAVITASATEEGDDWPSWSNWGDDKADWEYNGNEVFSAPVALAAPGVEVLSTRAGGGTTTMSGTSMASPHVAGSAAAHLYAEPYDYAEPDTNNYSAFENTHEALLENAEDTDTDPENTTWSNTSNNDHEEPFVKAPAP